jgi:predicted DNA-binding transcriptional regulator
MSNIHIENKFINILEETGLNYNEALVYFTLIKSGMKGNIVKELNHVLSIQRTNMYSILHKLIKFGCVKEGGQAEKAKNATIFIANEPKNYIDILIEEKQNELEKLKDIKLKYSNSLQTIFQEGMEVPYEEIDSFIKPYFKPLLKKGWKIKSYIIRKEMSMFDYDVYDCMLYSPQTKLLKDNSFHIFIFDYNIENNESALKFFSQGLKRKTRDMKSYFFDIKDFQLIDDEIEFYKKTYPIFKMMVKVKDLKNSKYFESISKDLKKTLNNQSKEFYEIGKAVILPIREKLFYLWAESDEILKEMVEPIFRVEKIPIVD